MVRIGTHEEVRRLYILVDDIAVVSMLQGTGGLADEVRVLFPDVVDVVLEAPAGRGKEAPTESRSDRSAHDLFGAYLRDADIDDPKLVALFDALYEEAIA